MTNNTITKIVKNDFCIGCGVCAGTCPSNNLVMNWSTQGELIPYSENNCKEKCSICLDVCPFYGNNINQDDIADSLFSKIPNVNYNKYTGYYLNCFVGYHKDEEKRLKSASGGLASSFLSSLIDEDVIDNIVAVGISDNKNRIFDFKILSKSDEVYSCSGSVYYPVELSQVLKRIFNEKKDKRYAIIALPCVVYALRLAMEKIPKLKRRIHIIASLTCGQLQNRFYSELLALESGIKVEELSKIDFRRKKEGKNASDYLHVAISQKGKEGKPQTNLELPFHLWYYQFFKHNACNYCDDIFGELADITFMDAWLPEYMEDYRGTSLVITRTSLATKILDSLQGHNLNTIDVQKVIESQKGVIEKKRVLISGKLYKKKLSNNWYPKKRLAPDVRIYRRNKEFIELTEETQILSKKLWPKHRWDRSTQGFWEDMKNIESRIKLYERKAYLFKLPFNLIKKIIEVYKNG